MLSRNSPPWLLERVAWSEVSLIRCLDARSRDGKFFMADVFKRGISTTSRSTCFRFAHRLPPRWLSRAKSDGEFEMHLFPRTRQWFGCRSMDNLRAQWIFVARGFTAPEHVAGIGGHSMDRLRVQWIICRSKSF